MTDNATDKETAARVNTEAEALPEAAAPELNSLLAKISDRIADTSGDEPEGEAMDVMRERLEVLRDQASAARERIKVQDDDTFASVEAALERLAVQVDAGFDNDLAPVEEAPAPFGEISQAADPEFGAVPALYENEADVSAFNEAAEAMAPPEVPEPVSDKAIETQVEEQVPSEWQQDDADALASHCEDVGLSDVSSKEDLLLLGSEQEESAAEEPVSYVYEQPDAKEIGQQWFEKKFSELANSLEDTVEKQAAATQGLGTSDLAALNAKIDAVESQLVRLLGTPGTDSDEATGGALQDIELCIAEIAGQIEEASKELKRIETLENQIAQLSETLTSKPAFGPEASAPFDAAAIAEIVAERISQQAPSAAFAATGANGTEEISQLSAAVKEFIRERRDEGQHANSVLDTMQQTVMRLLDRMESLEQRGPTSSTIEPAHPAAKPKPVAPEVNAGRDPVEVDASAQAPVQEKAAGVAPAYAKPAGKPAFQDMETERAAALDRGSAPTFGRKRQAAEAARGWLDTGRAVEPALADEDAESLDRLQKVVGELGEDREVRTQEGVVDPVARSRGDFIAAARRAAAKAGGQEPARSGTDAALEERAKLAAQARRIGNPDAADINDDDIDQDEIDATRDGFSLGSLSARFRPKKKKANNRARLLVVTLTMVAVGLGASKFIMSQSGESARQQLLSQQEQQQPQQKQQRLSANDAPVVQPQQPIRQMTQKLPGTLGEQTTTGRSDGVGNGTTASDLVQPAAISPETARVAVNGEVTGGRGKVTKQELPSMLVGPLSLRLAAASGDPSAEFQVAARFADGSGVPQDLAEAIKWYGRSASRGFALAQYRLGTMHERGLGVPKDINRAKVWYQRAAANGNIKAMHNLAVLAAGPASGEPDYATAAGWFTKAAERGLADSQFNLAILYENGLGVTRSQSEAYKWFSLAAIGGDKEAIKRMTGIAAKLGKKRVSQLDRETSKWKRKSSSKMANDPHYAGQAWQRNT